jgi:hypothetical protein
VGTNLHRDRDGNHDKRGRDGFGNRGSIGRGNSAGNGDDFVMADLALDLNPLHVGQSGYKDLLLNGNDLCLTSDAYALPPVIATNPVLQNVLQRIRFFLGEWYLDNTQGIPYFQQILVKNPDQTKIDAIFSNIILGTPGVTQLSSYSFTVNRTTRVLTISFNAITTSGIVSYSGTFSPVTGGQT